MAGKVKCTCGWSWNKSDSSKKDMYICHECGRDNSNNIPKAQEGTQTISSKDKRGIELLIKETENAKKDKHELQTTGQIKNPKSIAYKSKVKKQPELKQDNRNDYEREYDREKGQAKEDKKQFKKNVVAPLDVATDIMQLGNFIPNPIAQTIGGIGNVAGMGIDAYQAYDDLSEGNYADAAINAGSVLLPMGLDSKTFRRNSKYLKPGQPLYPLSPQANIAPGNMNISRVNYIEPFTKVKGMTDTSLLANRALLGTLGAETIYDIPKQKNGGWLDNYNDSEVSLPEGFVGEGIFNGPKFDNPAWGGQFQMGGNLPGAVGNMYARTGSPSKGPRRNQTDVTDASAQNGKEMQYYQQGLDWKPKTISKNGGWLDNYDEAQNGKKFKLKDERELAYKTAESTNVKKKNFDLEQSKSNKSYINQLAEQQKENKRRKALTQDQREREDYNARNEERGSIQAPVKESKWDRTKAIVSNPLTAFGYAARNESLPTRFQHGERNTLDNAIDWINPLQGIAAASEIPGELSRGEYLNAGLSALDAIDLGVYAKGAMKASKPLLQKAGQQLRNIPTSIAPELRQGLQTAGIAENLTSSLKSGVKKGGEFITDAMNKKIGPEFSRRILPDDIEPFAEDFGLMNKMVGFKKVGSTASPDVDNVLGYLNLHKRTNTVFNPATQLFENANPEWFKPGMIEVKKNMQGHQMQDALYQLGIDEAKKQGLKGVVSGEQLLSPAKTAKAHQRFEKEIFGSRTTDGIDHDIAGLTQHMNPNVVADFMEKYKSLPKHVQQRYSLKEYIQMSGKAMSDLASKELSLGTTAAILGVPIGGIAGTLGYSMYESDKEFDEMNALNERIQEETDKQRQEEANRLIQENKTQTTKYYEGGIIKDDRGQWDHPGEITEINSNDITMEGVPYDVLGVSDTGDTKLMKPGKNYKFKGKKVTEYPMAKNGVNQQDQKTLQQLDQLTNFTNYNKPQPGGWLNKYN